MNELLILVRELLAASQSVVTRHSGTESPHMQGIPGFPPITWRDFGLLPAGAGQSLDD